VQLKTVLQVARARFEDRQRSIAGTLNLRIHIGGLRQQGR
jgi:hypothetical protein